MFVYTAGRVVNCAARYSPSPPLGKAHWKNKGTSQNADKDLEF